MGRCFVRRLFLADFFVTCAILGLEAETMADSTHAVRVIRITEIVKRPNADTLGLVRIGGYQVVVKLDEFEVGQLVA